MMGSEWQWAHAQCSDAAITAAAAAAAAAAPATEAAATARAAAAATSAATAHVQNTAMCGLWAAVAAAYLWGVLGHRGVLCNPRERQQLPTSLHGHFCPTWRSAGVGACTAPHLLVQSQSSASVADADAEALYVLTHSSPPAAAGAEPCSCHPRDIQGPWISSCAPCCVMVARQSCRTTQLGFLQNC